MTLSHFGRIEKEYGYDDNVIALRGGIEEIVPFNSTEIFCGYFRMVENIRNQLGVKNLKVSSAVPVLKRGLGIPSSKPRMDSSTHVIPCQKLNLTGMSFDEVKKRVFELFPITGIAKSYKWQKFLGFHTIVEHDFEDFEEITSPRGALDKIFSQKNRMFFQKWEGAAMPLDKEEVKKILVEKSDPSGALIYTMIDLSYADRAKGDEPDIKKGTAYTIRAKWDQVLFFKSANMLSNDKVMGA